MSQEKNRLLMVFSIFAVILLVAGCDAGKSKAPITDADIRTGAEGLKTEFVKNAPPENVFAEIGFPISLKLKNAGAFDIPEDDKGTPQIEGGIVVFGFEKAYIGILEGKVLFDIKGKSIYAPLGNEEFISINGRAGAIGPQSEKHPSTIFATACYPYKTVFGASVCIDPDIIGEGKGQKACQVKDLAFSEGQGGPVAVTKVETRMLPQQDENKIKPHFIIHVKNAGNGQVIKNGKEKVMDGGIEKDGTKEVIEKACSSESLSYKDFNILKVNAKLSGVVLDCDPKEGMQEIAEVRLREKEDLIRCTYDGKDDEKGGIDAGLDAYVAPLKVELDYGYTFTISKNIIIEKVLTH